MASVNKLIKFSPSESPTTYDTLTDTELSSYQNYIAFGDVARSNILNGLFRQVTKTNKVLGDLVMNNYGSDVTIDTANSDSVYEGYMKKSLENIAKGVAVTKDTVTFTGTKSGITVNSQGLVTNLVSLAYSDLPSIAQNTFLGRTATGTGAPSAISASTVLTTLGAVPTSRTIAGLDLSADRNRDAIIGVSSNGLVKRTAENTYTHYALVADDIPTLAISKITDLSTQLSGKEPTFTKNTAFNKNFGTAEGEVAQGNHNHTGIYEPANANIQTHISSTSNPHSVTATQLGLGNVNNTADADKYVKGVTEKRASVNYQFWVGSQAQYEAITPEASVIYIII